MTVRAILALALLLAAAGLAVPAFADEHGESDGAAPEQELSAFLQTQEAEMDAAVDDGVFEARVEHADESERPELVEQRVDELEARTDRVEERLDELDRAESNESVGYRARAAGVSAQLAALDRSLETTERRAEDAGVDSERLDQLRTRTSELSGRETARVARSIAGPPISDPGGGPPGDVGNGTSPDDGGPPGGITDDASEFGPDSPPIGGPDDGEEDSEEDDGNGDRADGDGESADGDDDPTDDTPGNADGVEDGGPPEDPGDGR